MSGLVRQRVLRSLLSLLLAAGTLAGVVTFGAQPATAIVGTLNSMTWNMQGNAGGTNWTQLQAVLNRALDRHARDPTQPVINVVALQEAGARPRSARPTGQTWTGGPWTIGGITYPRPTVPTVTIPAPPPAPYVVTEYEWSINRSTNYYIYHLMMRPSSASPAASTNSRNSLAILTDQQLTAATPVHFAPPQFNAPPLAAPTVSRSSRPAFGIVYPDGSGWWTVHAGSGNSNSTRNDASNMLAAINTSMAAAGVANWAALGDFNRNLQPGGLGAAGFGTLPGGTHVAHPQQVTRPVSGRELDYMITNDMTAGLQSQTLGMLSDHLAVQFGTTLVAAADVGQIRLRSKPDHCLDVAVTPGTEIGNGTPLAVSGCTGQSDTQYWNLEADGTITTSNGFCLDNYGGRTDDGNPLVAWQCHGNDNQHWQFLSNGEIYNRGSGRCLDANPPTDPGPRPPGAPEAGASLHACNESSTQVWESDATVYVPDDQDPGTHVADRPVNIVSTGWSNRILCVRTDNTLVSLLPASDRGNPYCQWVQIGDRDKFALINVGLHQALNFAGLGFLGYTAQVSYPTEDRQYFSWGRQQFSGGSLLRPYSVSGWGYVLAATDSAQTRPVPGTPSFQEIGKGPEFTWNTVAAPADTLERAIGEISAAAVGASDLSAVNVTSSPWPDRILCAGKYDDHTYLRTADEKTDPHCQWLQVGSPGRFALYNLARRQTMSYAGGNEQLVETGNVTYPTPNGQYLSWSGTQSWGGLALRPFVDAGQNVDAMAPGTGGPRGDQVRTRGWNIGNQRELTWNTATAPSADTSASTYVECVPLQLTSTANGQVVSTEFSYPNVIQGELRAHTAATGSRQELNLCDNADGSYSLTSADHTQSPATVQPPIISAELDYPNSGNGMLRARTYGVGPWEKFDIQPADDDESNFTIRSTANGLYVTAELGFTTGFPINGFDSYGMLRVQASSIGRLELFR